MSYEYDAGHTRIIIEQDKTMDGVTPLALIQMEHIAGGSSHLHVKPEDAPTVALAILEAAGIKSEHPGIYKDRKHPERMAMFWLEVLRDEREKKEAEREALDDKVRAYLNRVLLNPVSHLYRITDHDRAEYARAAEFFQGEQ